MTANPTADGGPLIMYLVAHSDRERADKALAIAHMSVSDYNVTAQAAGHTGVRHGYDPDPGYTGWTYDMAAAGSKQPVKLLYRAGICLVPTLNGTPTANAILHALCAEIVASWQQEGLITHHRDGLDWVADNRDPQVLMRALERFNMPKTATTDELLALGATLQRLLAGQPAPEPTV